MKDTRHIYVNSEQKQIYSFYEIDTVTRFGYTCILNFCKNNEVIANEHMHNGKKS